MDGIRSATAIPGICRLLDRVYRDEQNRHIVHSLPPACSYGGYGYVVTIRAGRGKLCRDSETAAQNNMLTDSYIPYQYISTTTNYRERSGLWVVMVSGRVREGIKWESVQSLLSFSRCCVAAVNVNLLGIVWRTAAAVVVSAISGYNEYF